ncbi:F0F1 ATP synthase subunit A [Flaviflexus huanghaiensis]|uniref:F0F1 ATP synthase subunit A n=1 Tax=Flaviflexus huanghaiensis TaxID=1111473 RepID=UPI0030CA19B1
MPSAWARPLCAEYGYRPSTTHVLLGAILFANASFELAAQFGRLAAAAEESGFHAPTLDEFFPEPYLFEGTPFAINRIIMARLIAVAVLATIGILYARRAKLVPGRSQAAFEFVLDFIRQSIGHEVIGEEKAARYLPALATLFLGVFFMNITGIVPGLHIASTSLVGMPIVYALFAYVMFIAAGIRIHGVGGYFKSQLMPAGVPWPIYILMTPIEFLSNFIVRPATLVIRLLANMVVGHLLLVLTFAATHALYFSVGGLGGLLGGTVTLAAGVAVVVFEILVAGLQAYVFALLAAVYLALSIEEH